MQQNQGSGTADKQPEHFHHNVVANRAGDVLIKHTLLKSDHFPGEALSTRMLQSWNRHLAATDNISSTGCQNRTLEPLLEGAPNYRQAGHPLHLVSWRTLPQQILQCSLCMAQVPELPVYGVAIPTVAGIRLVLDAIQQSGGMSLRCRAHQ